MHTDISDVSVEAAKSRYTSNKMMVRGRPPFEAEFICADCCQVCPTDSVASGLMYIIMHTRFDCVSVT
ncbi:MAG: hypothetical protein K8963_08085 [Proteobacteria bacterium]|nr:hypothetical protein [Pseudomonadota bacterium]